MISASQFFEAYMSSVKFDVVGLLYSHRVLICYSGFNYCLALGDFAERIYHVDDTALKMNFRNCINVHTQQNGYVCYLLLKMYAFV